jgi:hypothetical protein
MCRRFSYGNYTWKNTFGKRGGGVLVVSPHIFLKPVEINKYSSKEPVEIKKLH